MDAWIAISTKMMVGNVFDAAMNDKLCVILNEISDDYQINNDKLVKKYIDDIFDIDFSAAPIKKRERKQNKLLAKNELNFFFF